MSVFAAASRKLGRLFLTRLRARRFQLIPTATLTAAIHIRPGLEHDDIVPLHGPFDVLIGIAEP